MKGDVTPETRWAWVEIDTAALRSNTRLFKRALAPSQKLMAVVKADAYGHGVEECARVMEKAGADAFGVATVDEGIELRLASTEKPILILSEPPESAIPALVEYRLMPSVFQYDFALALGEAAAAADTVADYHLIVDTGMTRLGILPQDAVEFRRSLEWHRGLRCAGTFTHFATADIPGDWDWALQMDRFSKTVEAIKDAGMGTGIVHCDNTAATILHPETRLGMVRVGIGLYGLDPAPSMRGSADLEPVMSVRAKITRAVYPPVGSGVSYGMLYRVAKPTIQIATVPVGYADGYSRILSGHVEALVHGRRIRQVGNICMDQSMFAIDVNQLRTINPVPPVEAGDVVTLMGRDGSDAITADELAGIMGTINYEIVCGFGMRLPKVYV